MTAAREAVPDDVLDAVREDAALGPMEKETTFRFAKDEGRATVFTYEAGLTRRLLAHPEFNVDHLVRADGAPVESVEAFDATADEIVAVKGTIPIGCLKVRASSRSTPRHSMVVTHPTNTAFGGGE
jgi:hypothetical protein